MTIKEFKSSSFTMFARIHVIFSYWYPKSAFRVSVDISTTEFARDFLRVD